MCIGVYACEYSGRVVKQTGVSLSRRRPIFFIVCPLYSLVFFYPTYVIFILITKINSHPHTKVSQHSYILALGGGRESARSCKGYMS